MSTEICIHGNDPMTCDERPDGRCHVPKRPCPECGKDATEVCVHMQRLLAAIEEPRMSTDPRIDAAIDVLRNTGYGLEADAVERLAGAERQVAAIRALAEKAKREPLKVERYYGQPVALEAVWADELLAALGVTPTEPPIHSTEPPRAEDGSCGWCGGPLSACSPSARSAGSVAPTEPDGCNCETYECPTSGETECLQHGGFDVCCDDPTCPAFGKRRSPAPTEPPAPTESAYFDPDAAADASSWRCKCGQRVGNTGDEILAHVQSAHSSDRCRECGGWLDRPNDPSSDAYYSGMCQLCLNGPLPGAVPVDEPPAEEEQN